MPNSLRTALKKYVKYRETNPQILRGITKAGLKETLKNLYRGLHIKPSDEAASILRWNQKDKDIEFEKREFDFSKLKDLDIAKTIRKKKIPYLGVLSELARAEKKITPAIAVAMLEQATGNQAVILRKTFDDAGILDDKKVKKLYDEKIREAKTALDRVENISKEANEQTKEVLKAARSEVRKEQMGDIGKIFLHVDFSPSMEGAIEYAKKNGALIAEMVKNPKDNFAWGRFDEYGKGFPVPESFEEDAFAAVLFGQSLGGGTDMYALYARSRRFGAEVDIFVSDGEHNCGDLIGKLRRYHSTHPKVPKPKAMVLIRVKGHGASAGSPDSLQVACEDIGVPYAEMDPVALESSALVVESVKRAIKGPMAVIDSIMETELPPLPDWYLSL